MNIMVVDDARLSREAISGYLTELGHRAEAYENPFQALEALEGGQWDLVVTDFRMPSMDGLQFLKEIRVRTPETAVIIMTAYGTIESAIQAIRDGALDYLIKPFPTEQLRSHVERLRDLLSARRELETLRKSLGVASSYAGLVGSSPEMQKVFQLIEQFADKPANVLIIGETGTGKEMVARALHQQSSRRNGPFIPVACGAVPRELAESELFGHEAGAFTGAVKQRRGCLEMAHGGTLFLDDVDDLPMEIQPKLLRAIQERQFQRVGGEKMLKFDIRIISSTKRDLEALAHENKFRQDVLYRLQVLSIPLPPLRERKGDVLVLARHFLELLTREAGGQARTLSEEAEMKLKGHAWPGNVRELRHAIEYASAVAAGPTIVADDLQLRSRSGEKASGPYTLNLEARSELDLRSMLADIEKEATFWALKKAQGDQGRAAEILKIPRTTLIYKLRQYSSTQGDEQRERMNVP